MIFKKFTEYVEQKLLEDRLNRNALDYDKRLAQFNSRFKDPEEANAALKSAGYDSIASFVSDPDERKWSRLRIPGQENYSKK